MVDLKQNDETRFSETKNKLPLRRTQVTEIETLGSIEVIKKLVSNLFYGGKG